MENQGQKNEIDRPDARMADDATNHSAKSSRLDKKPEGTGIGGTDISGEDSDTRNLEEGAESNSVQQANTHTQRDVSQKDELNKLREDIE